MKREGRRRLTSAYYSSEASGIKQELFFGLVCKIQVAGVSAYKTIAYIQAKYKYS